MKIAQLEIIDVGYGYTGSNCFVRLTTDDGTTGLGQSGGWAYSSAVADIVRSMEPLIVGFDPFRIEHLWHRLYRARPFRGNLITSAVAAVDNALWDIKGKSLGVPVWELLGGRYRDKVRLHTIVKGQTPDEIALAVTAAVAEGFTAIKFDPLHPDHDDQPMVALLDHVRDMMDAARGAAGREVDLIADLHRQLDAHTARAVCAVIEPYEALFIEDPLQIDTIKLQGELCAEFTTPIAVGERFGTAWEFSELLDTGAPMVLRPDVGMAGGLSHVRKIAALAEARHCGLSPHNFLGPGLTAPTLHLAIAVPNIVTVEYVLTDEAPEQTTVRTSAVREGGYLLAPEAPGLGIELADDHDSIFPVENRPLKQPRLRADGSVADAR